MIKPIMFYGEPTIKEYREMKIEDIIKEFLLTKGTWYKSPNKDEKPHPINKEVFVKDLVSSGLFVYGLKDNPTNRLAVQYYCERWGHIHQIIDRGFIRVPEDVWKEADKKNEEFTKGRDRKITEKNNYG